MEILLIDNYDSFTFNLVHYLEGLGASVLVQRNDQVQDEAVSRADALVFSPGPGLPADAGEMPRLIQTYYHSKPMLGVCLGMQALCEAFGDELYNLDQVRHGVASRISALTSKGLYADLPQSFEVGLYHSWAVRLAEHSPFAATAYNEEGVLMSVQHKTLPIYGVQYHPESVLTPHGKKIMANFLREIQR